MGTATSVILPYACMREAAVLFDHDGAKLKFTS